MTQFHLNAETGRGRFFQRLTDTLVLIDRQAGHLTDQAGQVILGEDPIRDDPRGGLVEGLFGALAERGNRRP